VGYTPACSWQPYFSEETGTQNFSVSGLKGPFYATGVRCSGSNCDNMSYYVCGNSCLSCTSNAQCGAGTHCGPNNCCAVN
jgi:hypothetical protein